MKSTTKTTLLLLTLISCTIWLAGCKKTNSALGVNNPPSRSKVKSVMTYDSINVFSSTTSYTYDNQGRQLTKTYNSGSQISFDSIYYSNDTVYNVSTGRTYTLNSQGLATTIDGMTDYFYDANGYPTFTIENLSITDTFTYTSGDLTKAIYPNNEGVEVFTYLSQNDSRDYGQPYFGKTSTHLVSTFTETQTLSATTTTYYTYTYTYDAQGRVLTQNMRSSTSTGLLNGNTQSYYTYY